MTQEFDALDEGPPSGERDSGRGRHFPWRAAGLAGAIVVALWVVLVGLTSAQAALDLRAGRRAALRAQHTTLGGFVKGDGVTDLTAARRDFRTGGRHLDRPWMIPARVLPIAGRQLRAARALAGTAEHVASVGLDAIGEGRRVLGLPHRTGPDRIAQLRSLASVAARTDRRLTGLQLGPAHALVGPLSRAHRQLADRIASLRDGLQKGAAGGEAMAELLSGPRRYLLFAANNAEMRAGSGMFLSVGDVQTADGDLRTPRVGSVHEVPVPPGVPVEGDLGARWGWLQPSIEWRNLMLSPRFDASAALGTRMWAAAGRGDVDGVIALDPVALKEILAATGPLDANGRTVDAATVERELFHDQYVRFPVVEERREELSSIATATLTQLQHGDWSASKLADGLARAARGRHIFAWSTRPTEERAWEAAGIAGALREESLLAAVINRGGNKLDQYLPVRAALELHTAGNHTDGVLRVTLRNQAPADDPSYVIGPDRRTGLNAGEYLGIVAVTLPGPTREGRLEGFPALAVAGADGPTRVIGAEVLLATGAERTVVARFRLPGRHGALRVEPSARVPAIQWVYRHEHWADIGSHIVRW